MELSKCNLDKTIQKSTFVTSDLHGFGVNIIFFPVENIYWNLEVVGDIQENDKRSNRIGTLGSIKCIQFLYFTQKNSFNFNSFLNFIVKYQ